MTAIIRGVIISMAMSVMLAGNAFAQTTYTIQALGSIDGGDSLAYGLNESGMVVGQSYNSISGENEAVVWNGGTIQSLGFKGIARAVNNSGIVVGETGPGNLTNPTGNAFSWDGVTTTNLTTLGGAFSGAYDINDAGQITGFSNIDPLGYTPTVHRTNAFIYENGTMTNLGTVSSPTGYSRGHGINDAGEIAGRASLVDFENSQKHQATWDAAGNISSNDPGVGIYSTGQQINNDGVVVGLAYDDNAAITNFDRAAVWDSNGFHFMDDLGSGHGRAWSINDDGVIVGFSYDSAFAQLATVSYDGQNVIDLNTVVTNLMNAGFSKLLSAYDINELGQIVGYGELTTGETQAFLLTPTAVPVPAAAWLFGSAIALLGWARRRV